MLYRDPEATSPETVGLRLRRLLSVFARRRQRRLTELDLSSVNEHLRQDLGLCDFDPFRR